VEVKDAVRGVATTTTLRLTTNVASAAAAGGSSAGTRCVAGLNVDGHCFESSDDAEAVAGRARFDTHSAEGREAARVGGWQWAQSVASEECRAEGGAFPSHHPVSHSFHGRLVYPERWAS
jgi:hypothetical protein